MTSRNVSAPLIKSDANMFILEKLVELRKEWYAKVNLADDNGMYSTQPGDTNILNDINSVIKFVAAGGFCNE